MKRFRPLNAGYIVLYSLTLITAADVVYSFISSRINPNSFASSFMLWSALIFVAAIFYSKHYFSAKIEIGERQIHIVRPVYVKPAPGAKRANFLFRQGDLDNVLVERRIEIADIEKYGYIEAFDYKPEDKSGATTKNKLFPLHEVAFVLNDGSHYNFNAAVYGKKKLAEIVRLLEQRTGKPPEGELANAVNAQ